MEADEREAVLEQAYDALEAGKADEAEQTARGFIQKWAQDSEGYVLLAESLVARELADDALEALQTGLKACPQHPRLLGARASISLDVFDDPLGAAEDLEFALTSELGPMLEADLRLLYAETCLHLQRPELALTQAIRTTELVGDDADAHVLVAQALFELHRFDEARAAIARAIDRDPRCAAAYHVRGELCAATDDTEAADKAFSRARQLAPESYPEPPTVDDTAFAEMLEQAMQSLPTVVVSYLQNVTIVVEARPDLELLRQAEPPLSPACLGLFDGTPRAREAVSDPWSVVPKRVLLYKNNIVRMCADEDEVMELIASTLLQELGQFLDLDEEELLEHGLQ